MANEDLMGWAMSYLFISMFVGGIFTLASGGQLLIFTNLGQTTSDMLSGGQPACYPNCYVGNINLNSITPNVNFGAVVNKPDSPLVFDVILAALNYMGFLFSMFALLAIIFINSILLPVWLLQGGAPGLIVALIYWVWQYTSFRYLLQFIMKDRIRVK